MFQLHAVGENSGQFEETVHPYISKVLMVIFIYLFIFALFDLEYVVVSF